VVAITNRPPTAIHRTNAPGPAPALTNRTAALAVVTNLPTVVLPPRREPPMTNLVIETPVVKPLESVASGVQVARYRYLSPAKPQPGDRTRAQGLFVAAQKAEKENRLADAVLNYEAATKVDPAYYEAFALLAQTEMEAGDKVKALTAYESALAINPEGRATRFNFALALHKAGYPLDAAEEFEKYYLQNPKDSTGRQFLAGLYANTLKMPAKARAQYQALLELEPQHPEALAIREWLHRNQ
jgi:tetratricopeptide (TPR) repeat protein